MLAVLLLEHNRTLPFYHFVPLILLLALDVGEAAAPALLPTQSLHYSLHNIILLPPALRHGSPLFCVLVHNTLQYFAVCLCHHMSYVHFELNVWSFNYFIIAFFTSVYMPFPPHECASKEFLPSLLKAENPSLETDESRIGHAVHFKPKAAVSPPTHLLKAIFKLHKSGTARHFPLSLGGGGCIIKSKQPTHL